VHRRSEGLALNKDRTPTQGSFQSFLRWLDQGADSGGKNYLEMQRRLVAYFDRKNCRAADELADETLARVAQKLHEKGEITDLSPAHYCYVTARFVFLEYLRHAKGTDVALEEISFSSRPVLAVTVASLPDSAVAKEQMLECLDVCLKKLSSFDSELILEYYQGEQQEKIQRRRRLGERLGLSANALTIRACRIRDRVERCVRSCCRSS
jgi:DNA-directed RNA polymerase specialized sigma24 family protein